MKKSQTKYYFINEETRDDPESLNIKVNEEELEHLDYKPIWIDYCNCWRNPKKAIKFYRWVIKCIEEVSNQKTN